MFEWDAENIAAVAAGGVKTWEAEQAAQDIGWCRLGWNPVSDLEKGVGKTERGRLLFVLVNFGFREGVARVAMARGANEVEESRYDSKECQNSVKD